ncbi:unnamed protein product, partial [Mesorhabditis spiculigera]
MSRIDVVLSFSYAKGSIGAAYYDAATQTIHLFDDRIEDRDFMLVDGILEAADPTKVLANRNQDPDFLAHLARYCCVPEFGQEFPGSSDMEEDVDDEDEEGHLDPKSFTTIRRKDDGTANSREDGDDEDEDTVPETQQPREFDVDEDENLDQHAELVVLPNKAYKMDRAHRRVAHLLQASESSDAEQQTRFRFRFDLEMINMFRALGSLLLYLDSIRFGVERSNLAAEIPVKGIQKFTASRLVDMDKATFKALGIFLFTGKDEPRYRSLAAVQDHNRMSLFSLCDRTRSSLGRLMLKRWFEQPTGDMGTLQKRLATVKFLADEGNGDIAHFLHINLRKIISVRSILRRLAASKMKSSDWNPLIYSSRSMCNIGTFIKKRRSRLPLVDDLLPYFDEEVEAATNLFSTMIDVQRTSEEGRLALNRGIDPDLDFKYDAVASFASNTSFLRKQSLIESQTFGFAVHIAYTHSFKFTTVIEEAYFKETNPLITQCLYVDDGNYYVKTELTELLDEKFGHYNNEILDTERSAETRLTGLLKENAGKLLKMTRAIALLDAALSLAKVGRELGWCCPTLVEQSVIDADGAFHPLAALSLKGHFVRNTIRSNDDYTKVKIFTGPNASGKSIYLKMVGLITYLAHIGSFVPAERATIGPVDRLITRVYTVDTVLDGFSTFAHDIKQISTAVSRATKNSVVVIDEFGKGTLTEVGLAVLTSILNHWIRRVHDSPHVFVSSHFHALPSLIHKDPEVLSFHAMDAVILGKQLEFKYKVVDGLATSSYATHMAAEMGIPEAIVARTQEIYDQLCEGVSLLGVRHDDVEQVENERMLRAVRTILPRFLAFSKRKKAVRLLLRVGELALFAIASERVLPYLVHAATVETEASVRGRAIHAITQLLAAVEPQTHEEAATFMEYLLPKYDAIANETRTDSMAHMALAVCLGRIADTAHRYMIASRSLQSTAVDDEVSGAEPANEGTRHEKEATALFKAISGIFVHLCARGNEIKQCLVDRESLQKLHRFAVAVQGADQGFPLDHMVTFFNIREDWRLRAFFFDSLPHCVFNKKNVEALRSLFEQGIIEFEEMVVVKAINCIVHLTRVDLLEKETVNELFPRLAPSVSRRPGIASEASPIRRGRSAMDPPFNLPLPAGFSGGLPPFIVPPQLPQPSHVDVQRIPRHLDIKQSYKAFRQLVGIRYDELARELGLTNDEQTMLLNGTAENTEQLCTLWGRIQPLLPGLVKQLRERQAAAKKAKEQAKYQRRKLKKAAQAEATAQENAVPVPKEPKEKSE